MLDLNALRIFVEVIQAGSFAKAARKMELPSTNVSRKIQQLEKELGSRLLNRTTRSISITETGQQVYEKAMSLLETAGDIEQLTTCHQEEPQGVLQVTAPISFANGIFANWLIEYQLKYPMVNVALVGSNAMLDFQEHNLDFAVRAGNMPDSSLIARKMMSGAFGIFVSPKLIEGKPKITTIEHLKLHPCLATTFEGHALPWIFQKDNHTIEHYPNGAMRLEDNNLIHRAAIAGVGIAYLPVDSLKYDIKSARLVPILQSFWAPPIDIFLVYPSKKYISAKERSFIEFMLSKRKCFSPTATDS